MKGGGGGGGRWWLDNVKAKKKKKKRAGQGQRQLDTLHADDGHSASSFPKLDTGRILISPSSNWTIPSSPSALSS